jgi:hypothetical protein
MEPIADRYRSSRRHFESPTTSRASGGVYWIPKLSEELGKADMVLLLLGVILPHLRNERCLSLFTSVPHPVGDAAHRKSPWERLHGQGRPRASTSHFDLIQGRQRVWRSLRGAAAIMIVYRHHGER